MVLSNGKIKSDAGEWSYWQNDKYQPLVLLNFLSSDDPLGKSLFASMNELNEEMTCGEEHVMFKTFYYNA